MAPAAEPSPGPAIPDPRTPLGAEARRWIDQTLASLSLREKVGQLMVPWITGAYASTESEEFDTLARWVADERVGGVVISIGPPLAYAAKLNALQRLAQVPLLVTADFEYAGPGTRMGGIYALPNVMHMGGGTMFPPTMAFGAIGDDRFAYEFGRITAVEARAVGVHLNFAPVLDVNSNPDNPIINTRSFAQAPEVVARLAAAYVRGARDAGLLTTGKHFPGHGDTREDSHIELPAVPFTRQRLDTLELVPFRAVIEGGVNAIMTAHIAATGILGPDAPPATVSPYFLTDILRQELGFDGLVITDAMDMGGIVSRYGSAAAASVLALEAGADVILFPVDVGATIDSVTAAVVGGRITEARIDSSVRRMLELKARAGLNRGRFVDLEAVDEVVGRRAHTAFADTAAARSITLVRDRDTLVPIDPTRVRRILSVVFARNEDLAAGRAAHSMLAAQVAQLETARVDYATPAGTYDSLVALADSADLVLLSVYVSPRAGAGTVKTSEPFAAFGNRLIDRGIPAILLSFGNPYVLAEMPGVGTYLLGWGGREVSQRAATWALLGETAIQGRLPISLPPFHRAGEGLVRVPLIAAALPRVAAADVGLDAARLARVDAIIDQAIADSATPGASLAVARRGGVVRLRGYGALDWESHAAPVTDSSIFDLASLTKVVGTTTAMAILYQEGRLDLDAAVSTYLPWFTGSGKERITVRQLLLHRGGLPAFYEWFRTLAGRDAYRDAIAATDLIYAPGDSTVYSDIGFMTLGFLVEERSGIGLDRFLEHRVFRPLGMRDTGFLPDHSLRVRIAPTELDTVVRHTLVHGVVHDENAYRMGGVSGHAGLFSSARDLAIFAEMLLNGGCVPGRTRETLSGAGAAAADKPVCILEAATIAAFTQRADSASSRSLGWDTPSPRSSAGDYLTDRAFGHTGFTGTSLWIDPSLELFVVLLTNRVNPTRANGKHIPLRRAVHDAVAQAVIDGSATRRE